MNDHAPRLNAVIDDIASAAGPEGISRSDARSAFRAFGAAGLFETCPTSASENVTYQSVVKGGVERFSLLGRSSVPLGLSLGLAAHYSAFIAPLHFFELDSTGLEVRALATRGELIGAHGTTETGSGSRSFELQSRLDGVPGEFPVLTGNKDWITNALVADMALVQARTGDDGGMMGLSSALVSLDVANGVHRAEYPADPLPGSNLGRLEFNDSQVSGLVDGAGKGGAVFMIAMDCERIVMYEVLRVWAERRLRELILELRQRRRGTMKLTSNDVVRHRLARAQMELDLAGAAVRHVCAADLRLPPYDGTSERVKVMIARAVQLTVDELVEIGGADWYLRGISGALMEQATAARFMSGPNDVLMSNYARHSGIK